MDAGPIGWPETWPPIEGVKVLTILACEYNIASILLPTQGKFPKFFLRKQKFPTGGNRHQTAALPHPFTQDTGNTHSFLLRNLEYNPESTG